MVVGVGPADEVTAGLLPVPVLEATAAAAWTPAAHRDMSKGRPYPEETYEAIRACAIWAAKALGFKNEAKEADEAEAAAAAADWAALAVAKLAKSNFNFSEEEPDEGGSRLPLLVSEGLSSLLVGLFGGECLATAEKAEFSLENPLAESLDFDNSRWWWGRLAAAKRLL